MIDLKVMFCMTFSLRVLLSEAVYQVEESQNVTGLMSDLQSVILWG